MGGGGEGASLDFEKLLKSSNHSAYHWRQTLLKRKRRAGVSLKEALVPEPEVRTGFWR